MSAPIIPELIRRTEAKRCGDGWLGRCPVPAHEDRRPSFSFTERGGRVLVKCFSGCEWPAIDEALRACGVEIGGGDKGWTTVYTIRSIDGEAVAQHVRVDRNSGKVMFWRGPNGERATFKKLGLRLKDLPLYRTETLAKAKPDRDVIIVEGESSADALARLGLLALATVTGSSSAPSAKSLAVLEGWRPFLWPDNADDGRKHMAQVGDVLSRLKIKQRTIEWKDATPKGDAADFVSMGGTADEVRELMAAAAPFMEATTDVGSDAHRPAEPLPDFLARVSVLPAPRFLLDPLIPNEGLCTWHGHPRTMKSLAMLDALIAITTGGCAFGLDAFRAPRPARVLFIGEEDPERQVAKRLSEMLAARGIDPPGTLALVVRRGLNLDVPEWQAFVLRECARFGPELLWLDPARGVTSAVDKGPAELAPFARFLRDLMRTTTAKAIALVHHDVKPLPTGSRDERERAWRASGGGIFSVTDAPVHFEKIDDRRSLVVPVGFKFGTTPPSFVLTLETAPGSLRLVGAIKTVEAAEADRDAAQAEAALRRIVAALAQAKERRLTKAELRKASRLTGGRGQDAFAGALRRLLAEGRAEMVDGPPPPKGGPTPKLVRLVEASPEAAQHSSASSVSVRVAADVGHEREDARRSCRPPYKGGQNDDDPSLRAEQTPAATVVVAGSPATPTALVSGPRPSDVDLTWGDEAEEVDP